MESRGGSRGRAQGVRGGGPPPPPPPEMTFFFLYSRAQIKIRKAGIYTSMYDPINESQKWPKG